MTDETPQLRITRSGFVALLGAPNAGKSTLVNQLVGAKVSIVTHKVQTTRAIVRGIATHGDAQPGSKTAVEAGSKDVRLALMRTGAIEARVRFDEGAEASIVFQAFGADGRIVLGRNSQDRGRHLAHQRHDDAGRARQRLDDARSVEAHVVLRREVRFRCAPPEDRCSGQAPPDLVEPVRARASVRRPRVAVHADAERIGSSRGDTP